MISIIAAAALAPAKLWRYDLVSPVGTASFVLPAMPKASVTVPKFEATAWYGQEVESIELDPLAREDGTTTIRLKGSDRPLEFVFASFDSTERNKKPRGTTVGLRCTMAVARVGSRESWQDSNIGNMDARRTLSAHRGYGHEDFRFEIRRVLRARIRRSLRASAERRHAYLYPRDLHGLQADLRNAVR